MILTWKRSWMMTSSSPYCANTFFENSTRLSRPCVGRSNRSETPGAAGAACAARAAVAVVVAAKTATITTETLNLIRIHTPGRWHSITWAFFSLLLEPQSAEDPRGSHKEGNRPDRAG